MSKRTEVREQFYRWMLEESPSAVAYWARTEWSDIPGDPEFSRLIVRELGDEEEPIAEFTIGVDSIATGWRKLLDLEKAGKWQHCGVTGRPIAAAEQSLVSGDGGEEYDACVIDSVVQLAILGEVRYG
jgi:hypothetical protein